MLGNLLELDLLQFVVQGANIGEWDGHDSRQASFTFQSSMDAHRLAMLQATLWSKCLVPIASQGCGAFKAVHP